jgi:hypothetical protein
MNSGWFSLGGGTEKERGMDTVNHYIGKNFRYIEKRARLAHLSRADTHQCANAGLLEPR